MMIQSTTKPNQSLIAIHKKSKGNSTLHPLYKLGSGAFGSVFLAKEQTVDNSKVVAVKIQRESNSACIINEANIQAEMSHPNIASMYNIRSIDGQPALVMEYISGLDIKTYTQEEALTTWDDIALLIDQLLDAVEHIHSQNIVHCDLKPSNILIDCSDAPQVKVIDFGAAQRIDAVELDRMYGTPYFMAPEQCFTPNLIDQRTDIFAIGKLIQRLLEGTGHYDNTTLDFLCVDDEILLMDKCTINTNVPHHVRTAIIKATQMSMEARFNSIHDFRAALKTPSHWLSVA